MLRYYNVKCCTVHQCVDFFERESSFHTSRLGEVLYRSKMKVAVCGQFFRISIACNRIGFHIFLDFVKSKRYIIWNAFHIIRLLENRLLNIYFYDKFPAEINEKRRKEILSSKIKGNLSDLNTFLKDRKSVSFLVFV